MRREFPVILAGLAMLAWLVAGPAAAQDRSLAVQWDGIEGLIAGVMSPDGASRSRLRVQHSGAAQECTGTLSLAKGGTEGSWALACPGGLAASGTYVVGRPGTATQPGREGEGTGTDTAGRRVSFIVGPRIAVAPVAKPTPAAPPAARKDSTADELNQAELERQRAERHEELQRQVRRNHEEAEAARAAKPPAPTAPPASASAPTIATGSAADVSCGFFKVRGLSLRANSIKCEESQRSGLGGHGNSTLNGASLTAAVQPGNAYLAVSGERDVDGIGGFRSTSPMELHARAKRWGDTRSGRNHSEPTSSPFMHVKMTITVSNNPWACAYGLMEGNRRAWGTSASRSYAYVTYCEPRQEQLSESNLQKIGAAIQLD